MKILEFGVAGACIFGLAFLASYPMWFTAGWRARRRERRSNR